jgi:hypothetical protein
LIDHRAESGRARRPVWKPWISNGEIDDCGSRLNRNFHRFDYLRFPEPVVGELVLIV